MVSQISSLSKMHSQMAIMCWIITDNYVHKCSFMRYCSFRNTFLAARPVCHTGWWNTTLTLHYQAVHLRIRAFYLRNTLVDASCIQIKPRGGTQGGFGRQLYDTTLHYITNKRITNNKLLSSKSLPWVSMAGSCSWHLSSDSSLILNWTSRELQTSMDQTVF